MVKNLNNQTKMFKNRGFLAEFTGMKYQKISNQCEIYRVPKIENDARIIKIQKRLDGM